MSDACSSSLGRTSTSVDDMEDALNTPLSNLYEAKRPYLFKSSIITFFINVFYLHNHSIILILTTLFSCECRSLSSVFFQLFSSLCYRLPSFWLLFTTMWSRLPDVRCIAGAAISCHHQGSQGRGFASNAAAQSWRSPTLCHDLTVLPLGQAVLPQDDQVGTEIFIY